MLRARMTFEVKIPYTQGGKAHNKVLTIPDRDYDTADKKRIETLVKQAWAAHPHCHIKHADLAQVTGTTSSGVKFSFPAEIKKAPSSSSSSSSVRSIHYPILPKGARGPLAHGFQGAELAFFMSKEAPKEYGKPLPDISSLPPRVKLYMLHRLLLNPRAVINPLYTAVLHSVTQEKQKDWDLRNTLPAQRTAETCECIQEAIRELHQPSTPIHTLYHDYHSRTAGGAPQKVLESIRRLMHGRLDRKETLLQHYKAICRLRGVPFDPTDKTFLQDPKASPEGFYTRCIHFTERTPLPSDQLSCLVEALASWEATEGAQLEEHLELPQAHTLNVSRLPIPDAITGRSPSGALAHLSCAAGAYYVFNQLFALATTPSPPPEFVVSSASEPFAISDLPIMYIPIAILLLQTTKHLLVPVAGAVYDFGSKHGYKVVRFASDVIALGVVPPLQKARQVYRAVQGAIEGWNKNS